MTTRSVVSAPRADDGFTLTEVLITTLLMGIVTIILLTTMTSLTTLAARTEARSTTLSSTRTALERVSRDLRAANPVDPLPTGVATEKYDNSITFKVYCASGPGCTSNLRAVTYAYDATTAQLTATTGGTTTVLQGPEGTSTLQIGLRRGAVLNTASQPVFRYYGRNGAQIATSPSPLAGQPPSYFRDCTKQVEIHLIVRSEANKPDQTTDLSTTVTLRNHNEVNPC